MMHSSTRAEFRKIIDEIPFNRILGIKLDAIEENNAVLSFAMREELIGNFMQGILHGGVISSVLDMAGGVAAMLIAVNKKPDLSLTELAEKLGKSSTINLHIDYLKPGKGSRYVAKAWVVHSGNRIVFTRMELFDEQNVLIAAGSAAYQIG